MQNHVCTELGNSAPSVQKMCPQLRGNPERIVRNTLPCLKLREFWGGSVGMHLDPWNFLNCIEDIEQSPKFTFHPLNLMSSCLCRKNDGFAVLRGGDHEKFRGPCGKAELINWLLMNCQLQRREWVFTLQPVTALSLALRCYSCLTWLRGW